MASQSKLVDNDAFSRLLEESPEKIPYEMGGYLYLTRKEKDGWVTYRTYGPKWRWIYQARRVLTMAGGAGAEIIRITITPVAGQSIKILKLWVVGPASAGSVLTVYTVDEDGQSTGSWIAVAAGASRVGTIPSVGTTASGNGNVNFTGDAWLGPGETLICNGSASANTETLTVGIVAMLSIPTVPTWATTGSGGAPTFAASTVSAANTMQAVLLP